jgi:hypothetical protein
MSLKIIAQASRLNRPAAGKFWRGDENLRALSK